MSTACSEAGSWKVDVFEYICLFACFDKDDLFLFFLFLRDSTVGRVPPIFTPESKPKKGIP